MKIAFVFFNDYQADQSPAAHLAQWFSITDWANALTGAGIEVVLFLRYKQDVTFIQDKVRYHFFKDRLPARLRYRHLPLRYTYKVRRALRESPPDLIHAHNLNSSLANLTLRIFLPSSIPMLIQDHGALLPATYHRWVQTFLFKKIDGLVFAAPGQEKPWREAGLIRGPAPCFFVMENSSPFTYQSRASARRRTGISGEPVFLWVGNLNENKDPLTVLTAFNRLAAVLPEATLYLIYRQAPLEKAVGDFIDQHAFLRRAVALLGSKNRAQLGDYYNSADYFLAGSHKEGSGYALIEALSCGVIPIVTDIPSFRELTAQGQLGGLWPAGDPIALLEKIKAVTDRPREQERERALAHFAGHFSFARIAGRMREIYAEVIAGHKRRIV